MAIDTCTMQKFYAQQQAAHKDVVVLAIDTDRVGDFVKVSALQQQLGLTYPIVVDDHFQARMRYQVSDVPVAYFVDHQHVIRSVVSGPLNEAVLNKFS